jgi:hypothetical protein
MRRKGELRAAVAVSSGGGGNSAMSVWIIYVSLGFRRHPTIIHTARSCTITSKDVCVLHGLGLQKKPAAHEEK